MHGTGIECSPTRTTVVELRVELRAYSVTPQRVNTFRAQRSDRLTLLHHRRLCTQLCPCVRRTWSGIIVLTLGSQLLLQRVVSATITSSPRVQI